MQPITANFWTNFEPKLTVLDYSIITLTKEVPLMDIEACFHTYYESLHRYAFTLLKDNEEAKDIVQQVFIKLWEKKEEIAIQQSAKAYLYRSVYNLCLNKIRDHKVRVRHAAKVVNESTEAVFMDEVVAKETHQRIHQAIAGLPPQCQVIFKKSRFEEKKYSEIAAELNISVKTVEAQMSKALKLVREKLLFVFILISFYKF